MIEAAAVAIVARASQPDRRALALAIVVGFSICVPILPSQFTAQGWYLAICMIDLCVCIIAMLSGMERGLVVARIHLAMAMTHIFHMFTNPYGEGFTLYPVIIPSLELISLAVIASAAITDAKGVNHGRMATGAD